MNARSIYDTTDVQRFDDRRGAIRHIRIKHGRNKGRVYPYASVRQYARQTRRAAYAGGR